MPVIYPWQTAQWHRLSGDHAKKKLPHALLIQGSEGVGKQQFAKALAALVLCGSGDEATCGHCRGCALFTAGHHPDYYFMGLEEKAKTVKVDQIRSLINALNQTAQQGTCQVAIIYPAEKMNQAASNALLKTLEEPLGNVLIMLVSDHSGTLLPTIRSRCQSVVFPPVQFEEAKQLIDNPLLLRISGGSPLKALQFEQRNYLSLRDNILDQLQKIWKKAGDPLSALPDLLKLDIDLIFHAMFSIIMDLQRVQLIVDDSLMVNADKIQIIKSMALDISPALLSNYLVQLQQSLRLYQRSVSINVQMLLENLFLKWMELKI
jgi:DNA polymerase-3 subunit delta'